MTREISFIYNSTVSYKVELGYKYARFTLADVFVCQIVTPYIDTDLLRIHYKQIGNTMRLTHPSYKPHKITRVSSTLFEISEMEFKDGPFMTRNDLLDINVSNAAYMLYTGGTTVNSLGNLFCCKSDGATAISFFDTLHVGALFKLITKKAATSSSWSFTPSTYTFKPPGATAVATYAEGTPEALANFLELSKILIKGTYTFTTSNFSGTTNTGTIILERNENDAGWENIRSETTSIIYSGTETEENVYFRSRVLPVADGGLARAGTIRANITSTAATTTSILKVMSYKDASNVTVKVIAPFDSKYGNTVTKQWAEGAWSDYRGWPISLTFYNDRCIYGGMKTIPEQVVY